MRARLPLLLLLLATLGGACTSGAPRGIPRAEPRVPVPQWVREVRTAVRSHDRRRALRILRADQPLDPAEPERAWLLAQLWPGVCQSERARAEARALPPTDIGVALRALTTEDPEAALLRLEAHRRTGRDEWPALASAHLHARVGDAAGGLPHALRASRSRRDFVRQEAELALCRMLRGAGGLDEARAAARRALVLDPLDARVHRALAEIHRRGGHLDDAVLARVAAVQLAPASEHYARQLAAQLDEGTSPQVWGALDRALTSDPTAGADNPELRAVRGRVAARAGRVAEGVALMESALASGARAVPLEKQLRPYLAVQGRYGDVAASLARAVPPGIAEAAHNLRRGHWQALAQTARAAPSPSAPGPARLALARALVGVGALAEAVAVAERVGTEEGRALSRRVRAHLSFEGALREEIEAGYRTAMRGDAPPTFEETRLVLRTLALQHLAAEDRCAFARPDAAVRSLPILGAWLDHRTDTASPTVQHFRRYGRFLLAGQQSDAPPEVIVLSLASLARALPIRSAGRDYTHDVVIGYDRSLRAYVSAQGGGLGGACLADGIWLDVDTARRTALGLRRALARDPAYGDMIRSSGALRADTWDGAFALTDPGCTAGRLVRRVVARHPDDHWGSFWTLRAHEFGHVADIRRHLPIVSGLPATIATFVDQGLSFSRMQMEFERRAQLGAIIDARDPDQALAEMVLSVPVWEREAEVHDGGYEAALAQIVRHIAAHPQRFPQIDPSARILTQLDRLSNEQIRAVARAALRR